MSKWKKAFENDSEIIAIKDMGNGIIKKEVIHKNGFINNWTASFYEINKETGKEYPILINEKDTGIIRCEEEE